MGKKIDYSATEKAQLTSEGKDSDLSRLQANGARALPSSPSASGWSADAIKRQLYRPSELLFAWLVKLAKAQLALAQKADDALDGETTRLDQNVAALNSLISSKEQSLLSEIASQVAQEAATRGSADTALDNRISREVSARQNEDAAIRELISAIADTHATKTKVAEIEGDVASLEERTVKKSEIVNNVTSDSSTDPLSAAQGKYLKGLIDAINTLLASDDTTLDELQEVVSYIKTNRGLITAITTSKVSVSDIIDALNSTATNKPLSANQGKVLKGYIDAIHTTLTPTITETYDLGSSSFKYKDLYLSGKVKDGTREMTLANIMEVSNALGTIDQILDQLNGEVV